MFANDAADVIMRKTKIYPRIHRDCHLPRLTITTTKDHVIIDIVHHIYESFITFKLKHVMPF